MITWQEGDSTLMSIVLYNLLVDIETVCAQVVQSKVAQLLFCDDQRAEMWYG